VSEVSVEDSEEEEGERERRLGAGGFEEVESPEGRGTEGFADLDVDGVGPFVRVFLALRSRSTSSIVLVSLFTVYSFCRSFGLNPALRRSRADPAGAGVEALEAIDELEEVRESDEDLRFEGTSRCRFFARAEAGDPGRGVFEEEAEGRGEADFEVEVC